MANKKISELESRASLSLSDLMAVGDPSTGYLYKTTISDLKTLTGAGVVSFNGRFGTVMPAEGDYTLTQLGDVIITSAANNDVLKYNGSNWVNTQLYTGTVAQYIDGTGAYQTFPTLLSSDRLVTNVRNTSGATITKGTVVYLNGSSGTLPTIAKAQANAESTSTGTYGVVQDNIANNANGYVVVIGNLTALDTSAYNAGDILWLSPTVAGGYTTTKPVAPNHAVYVGIVTRSSNTQGTIEVKIQNGYELDELHNVLITSVANNDVLVYETASSLWKNKAFSTLSTDTLDSVTGRGNTTTNDITVGSVTAAGLSNLLGQIKTFVSTGNTYIGASPASATDAGYKLDVNGTVRISNDLTMWDDGANNGNSRALILRALGSTGNVQTGQIILDGFGAAGQDQLQLSASNIRLSPSTGSVTITGTTPNISTVAASGFRLNANSTTNGFIFTQAYNQTSGDLLAIFINSNQKKFSVSHAGIVTVADLGGTGSRMVVADSAGNLSTQAIPTSAVSSVFGRTGAVVAASGDYTTSQVTEGSNLYYTDARARAAITLTTTGSSGAATYSGGTLNIPTYTLAGLGGQAALSGTGFVKISGTTISYDNSTYLTTSSAASTYLPLAGGTLTGALNGTSAVFSSSVTAQQLIIRNSGVPAAQFFRDLDVTVVGSAGQGIEFGARSGSTFIAGAAIYGGLDNPATTGNLVFQTLTSGSLTTKLTINSAGAATFSSSVTATGAFTGNISKSGSGIESADFLNFRLYGTNAIGDSLNIKFFNAGGNNVANISAILGGDNVAYGSLAFSTRNYFTDTMGEVMRITNRGNVGINITNPANRLQIGSVGSTGYGGNDFVIGNGSNVFAIFQNDSNTNIYATKPYSFQVSNVLIGTTADNTFDKLQSSGSILAGGRLRLGGGYIADAVNGNNIGIVFGSAGVLSCDASVNLTPKNLGTETYPWSNLYLNGVIKTGEPDTGWGRAAIKIGASVSGAAFNVTRYLPVSVDGTIYYINLNSSTP
jgi:hypothetical protein